MPRITLLRPWISHVLRHRQEPPQSGEAGKAGDTPARSKKRSVLRFWERRFLWETAAVYVEVLFNSMIVEIKRWLVLKWVKNSNRLPVIEGLTYTIPLQANFQKLAQFNPGNPCDPEKDQSYLGITIYKLYKPYTMAILRIFDACVISYMQAKNIVNTSCTRRYSYSGHKFFVKITPAQLRILAQ